MLRLLMAWICVTAIKDLIHEDAQLLNLTCLYISFLLIALSGLRMRCSALRLPTEQLRAIAVPFIDFTHCGEFSTLIRRVYRNHLIPICLRNTENSHTQSKIWQFKNDIVFLDDSSILAYISIKTVGVFAPWWSGSVWAFSLLILAFTLTFFFY